MCGDNPLARALQRLRRKGRPLLTDVLDDPQKYKLQIVLTEVSSGDLARHRFRSDREYFYPASTIKLCVAIAALRKVEALRSRLELGFDAWTRLAFVYVTTKKHEEDRRLRRLDEDRTNKDGGKICVAHLIRRIFLVSDNGSYNLLLDFVGKENVADLMRSSGYEHFIFNGGYLLDDAFGPKPGHSLVGIEILHTKKEIALGAGQIQLPCLGAGDGVEARHGTEPKPPLFSDLLVGLSHVDEDGAFHEDEPKDFSGKNQASLVELQDLLIGLSGVESSAGLASSLPLRDRDFLMSAMAQSPSQSFNPEYSSKMFPDSWNKFFLPGLARVRDLRAIRIYNKLGQAYGFSLDNAYVVDVEKGTSFFLTASIYTNANGIVNEDAYEYTEIGEPFLSCLAECVAAELGMVDPDPAATEASPRCSTICTTL
mmetsp:Transcript_11694/g.29810  ORF Transcript_11694/g.29810 Transcript_11694/m.29810 type:complete len:426 (-) Transcript_11694:88-1365(-)